MQWSSQYEISADGIVHTITSADGKTVISVPCGEPASILSRWAQIIFKQVCAVHNEELTK